MKDVSNYIATGPLEISNMTELKHTISGKDGKTFLPQYVLNHYDTLRTFAIDHLHLRVPLGTKERGTQGKSEKMR